jgi:hypothetical protein
MAAVVENVAGRICVLIGDSRRFTGYYCLHLHNQKANQLGGRSSSLVLFVLKKEAVI